MDLEPDLHEHDLDEHPARRVKAEPDPRLSRSLEYGLAMLQCFTVAQPALGIADMAQQIGLGRSTAHRYARTLVMLGYLEQDQARKYRLAARVHEPGMTAIDTLRRAVPARRVLEQLREWTGHTVALAALHGDRAIYVHRLHGHRPGQHEADLDLSVGAWVPLHSTAVGKALLAALEEPGRTALVAALTLGPGGPKAIRSERKLRREVEAAHADGLAFDDEELAPNVRAIAAPLPRSIVDVTGPLAVEVTVPAASASIADLRERVGPLLTRATERIAQDASDAASAP